MIFSIARGLKKIAKHTLHLNKRETPFSFYKRLRKEHQDVCLTINKNTKRNRFIRSGGKRDFGIFAVKKYRDELLAVFFMMFLVAVFMTANATQRASMPIPYQGRLLDTNYSPKADGTYYFRFGIYDASTGGSCLWATGGCIANAPTASVTASVSRGLFTVLLGNGGANNPEIDSALNSGSYFLGVTVCGTTNSCDAEMTPRKQLGGVPYAYNSDMLDGIDSAAFAILGGLSGGQTLKGGTAANNTLILQGNSATTGNTATSANINFKVGDSGGTTAMTILNNGNVGIGTSTPLAPLDIVGADSSVPANSTNQIAFQWDGVGGTGYGFRHWINTSHSSVVANNKMSFFLNTAGTAGGSSAPGTGNAEVLTLVGNGNVGIGTNSPSNLFVVNNGTIQADQHNDTTTTGASMDFRRSRGTEAAPTEIWSGDTIAHITATAKSSGSTYYPIAQAKVEIDGVFTSGQRPPSRWTFLTNAVSQAALERMRIDGSGNVGIGATTKLSRLTVVPGVDVTSIGGTTTANATTTITGTLTTFLTSLGIGDRISLSSASTTYATVTAIASDTSLTVSSALGNGTSQTILAKRSIARFEDASNATKLVINDQGYVGIGTTTPLAPLDIVGADSSVPANSTNQIAFQWDGVGGTGYGFRHWINTSHSGDTIANNKMSFFINTGTLAGGSSAPGTGNVEVLTLVGNGNVGIGDTSPTALFTVGSGDLFKVDSTGAITSVVGITSSSNYTQSAGTMSLTSANTTQASAFAVNVNSLTSGTGMYIASYSLSSGKLVDLQVSGTAAAANQTGLNILTAGANATAGITTYGAYISNTHTDGATSGTNVALYLNASGATTANYGLIVNAGNVGIGTTAPGYKLDVNGTFNSGALTATTGTFSSVVRVNSSYFWAVNGSPNFGAPSAGNVSGNRFLLYSSSAATATPTASLDWQFEYNTVGNLYTGGNTITFSKENATDGQYGQFMSFWTRANGVAAAERMRIDSSGNVGIGTTSPGSLLHISMASSDATGPELRLANTKYTDAAQPSSGDDMGMMTFYGRDRTSNTPEGGRIWTEYNGNPTGATSFYSRMSFGVRYANTLAPDANPILNIVSSSGNAGNVGIGTTAPSARLDVYGAGIRAASNGNTPTRPSVGMGVEMEYAGDVDNGIIRSFDRTGAVYKPLSLAGSVVTLDEGGTTVLTVDGGNVVIGSTSGGTYNGNFIFSAADLYPSLQIRNATTVKGQIIGSASTGGIWIDAPGNLSIRDTLNGGTTLLSLNASTDAAAFAGSISATTGTFSTSISTPSIVTASGALGITPAAGSNVNIALSTTGDFAVNTNQLYVDTSVGNVGIGITSPSSTLDVVSSNFLNLSLYRNATGASYGSGINFDLNNFASSRVTFGQLYSAITTNTAAAEDGYMVFRTVKAGSLTEHMRITKDGNVGIGTATPAGKLDVNGTILAFGELLPQSNNLAAAMGSTNFESGSTKTGWTFGNSTTITVSSTVAYNGRYSLKGTGAGATDTNWSILFNSPDTTGQSGGVSGNYLKAGQYYTVGAWVYIPSTSGVSSLGLALRDGETNFWDGTADATSSTVTATDTWTYIYATILFSGTVTNKIHVWFNGNNTGFSKIAYIDNFYIVEGRHPIRHVPFGSSISSNTLGIDGNVGIGINSKLSRLTVVPMTDQSDIGGTTTANGATTIAGTGTTFLTSLGIGDRISLSSNASIYATVTAIASDISLTVSSALGVGGSQTINVKRSIARFEDASNATKLVINDQGNVGIGTTTPNAFLTVGVNGTHNKEKISLWSTSEAHMIGTENYHFTIGPGDAYTSSVGTKFYSRPNELIAQIGFGENGAPTNRLNSYFAGNVGIGTTSPSTLLTVNNGTIRVDRHDDAAGTGAAIDFRRSRGTEGTPTDIANGDTIAHITTTARMTGGNDFVIAQAKVEIDGTFTPGVRPPSRWTFLTNAADTAAAERMRIDSAGRILVNGTAAYGRLGQLFEINTLSDYGGIALNTWSATAAQAPLFDFNRSKAAAIGTHTTVLNGDTLGRIVFRGSIGEAALPFYNFVDSAEIRASVDGEPNTSMNSTDVPGNISFWTKPDASTGGAVYLIERMSISNSGRVSIGKSGTNMESFLTFYPQTSGQSIYHIWNEDVSDLKFGRGAVGSESADMTLRAGKLGIGTTSPAGLFHVSSDTAATGLTFFTQANASADGFDLNFRKAYGTGAAPTVITTADELGIINFTGYGGATGYITGAAIKGISSGTIADNRVPGFLSFWTGTDAAPSVLTERMRIAANGDVSIVNLNSGSGTQYVCVAVSTGILSEGTTCSGSDVRLKTNITKLSSENSVLDSLKELRGVYFNWEADIAEGKDAVATRQIGMIAQEVEIVFPELVETGKDGYKRLQYDKFTAYLLEVAKAQQALLEPFVNGIAIDKDYTGEPFLTVDKDGRVGIGTNAQTATLDVWERQNADDGVGKEIFGLSSAVSSGSEPSYRVYQGKATTDQNAPLATINQLTVQKDTLYSIEAKIIQRNPANGNGGAYTLKGVFKTDTNEPSMISQMSSVINTDFSDSASALPSFDVLTNGIIKIIVTDDWTQTNVWSSTVFVNALKN